MKKYHFIIILLFSFVLLGVNQPVYSEAEARLEELSSQQARIEQMKTFINSLFVMAKDSDKRETVENALNELLSKIDGIQERVKLRIEEVERERRVGIMETTDDWKELAKVFLEEPTLDNFDYFCKRSREIDGWENKEVLSNDRKKMITVNKTLYESFGWCRMYLEHEGYIFIESDVNHKIKLLSSDTDEDRKYKIRYNEKIEELASNYDFYVFHLFPGEESKNPSLHIKKCLEEKNVTIFYDISFFCEDGQFLNLESPEKIISEIIGREEPTFITERQKQELKEKVERLQN